VDTIVKAQIIGFTNHPQEMLDGGIFCPLVLSSKTDVSESKIVRKLLSDENHPDGYILHSGRGRKLKDYELAPDDPPQCALKKPPTKAEIEEQLAHMERTYQRYRG